MQTRSVILSGVWRGFRAARSSRTCGFSDFRSPHIRLSYVKSVSTLFCCVLFVFVSITSAQDFSSASNTEASKPTKGMVTFLFPEQISISAQKSTAVDLHFRVADGLHINSHTPREKSLIPTNLAIAEASGLKVTGVDFPAGADYAFAFDPSEKLSVYTGEFTLKAHLTAPAGNYMLQGLLRYQACDSRSCYPPKTIPVAVDVIAK
jgi:Disulphide bond corrector protein DsbC